MLERIVEDEAARSARQRCSKTRRSRVLPEDGIDLRAHLLDIERKLVDAGARALGRRRRACRAPAQPASHDARREAAQARSCDERRISRRKIDARAAAIVPLSCDRLSRFNHPIQPGTPFAISSPRCTRCTRGLNDRRITTRPPDRRATALARATSSSLPARRAHVRLAELARRVAASDCTVLIVGESGTGKEVLARFIHRHSARAHKPVHRGQLRGDSRDDARSDAVRLRARRVHRRAQQRTPANSSRRRAARCCSMKSPRCRCGLQAKLLRVLQEREVERLGGRTPIALDVRVLATTNRRLREEVAAGRFREDLYCSSSQFAKSAAAGHRLGEPDAAERRFARYGFRERRAGRRAAAGDARNAEGQRLVPRSPKYPPG